MTARALVTALVAVCAAASAAHALSRTDAELLAILKRALTPEYVTFDPKTLGTNVTGFLSTFDRLAEKINNADAEIWWKAETNVTDANNNAAADFSPITSEFSLKWGLAALGIKNDTFIWSILRDDVKRQINKIADVGTAAQTNVTKTKMLTEVVSNMSTIYSTGKVMIDGKELDLEPGLTDLFESGGDHGEPELRQAWKAWRDVTGRRMRGLYTQFVQLSNEAVSLPPANFKDTGDYWRSWYESDTFEKDLRDLWYSLKPLYDQLHAYVRRKLRAKYGDAVFPVSGHIPAHLLGNMWAQQWFVEDIVRPFPNAPPIDVTSEMKNQNYTVDKMFQTADDFFASLGLKRLTQTFWNKSERVRPKDRDFKCHASAWDFFKDDDYRIKMCTVINQAYLTTIHHEMGHIQYYMQYHGQPVVFREGANPGFHEAIGDTMALSVGTPEHLEKIGLLKGYQKNNETDINYLLSMALEKIAFLPFGYLIDQWRWGVFSGQTPPDRYNEDWWKLRCGIQGVSPPLPRSEQDFDAGAKSHVSDNTPYIRYFVSFVIQFQFYEALCAEAGHTGPLSHCDFYQSTAAGAKLKNLLEQGSSKPWPVLMKEMTGSDKMEAGPIIKYFQPLIDFLEADNRAHGERPGWDPRCPLPVTPTDVTDPVVGR